MIIALIFTGRCAHAQQTTIIQHLAEINGQLSVRAAIAESQLDGERANMQTAQKQAEAVNDYWKAWCGDRPGCATPEAK